MTEIFLVNYAEVIVGELVHYNNDEYAWLCDLATPSLAEATDAANNLRKFGYTVNVQSILIDEDGRVKL